MAENYVTNDATPDNDHVVYNYLKEQVILYNTLYW